MLGPPTASMHRPESRRCEAHRCRARRHLPHLPQQRRHAGDLPHAARSAGRSRVADGAAAMRKLPWPGRRAQRSTLVGERPSGRDHVPIRSEHAPAEQQQRGVHGLSSERREPRVARQHARARTISPARIATACTIAWTRRRSCGPPRTRCVTAATSNSACRQHETLVAPACGVTAPGACCRDGVHRLSQPARLRFGGPVETHDVERAVLRAATPSTGARCCSTMRRSAKTARCATCRTVRYTRRC